MLHFKIKKLKISLQNSPLPVCLSSYPQCWPWCCYPALSHRWPSSAKETWVPASSMNAGGSLRPQGQCQSLRCYRGTRPELPEHPAETTPNPGTTQHRTSHDTIVDSLLLLFMFPVLICQLKCVKKLLPKVTRNVLSGSRTLFTHTTSDTRSQNTKCILINA